MSGWWLASYVVLWILTVAMFVVLLVVLRQLGLMYVRGGGAPRVEEGPPVGATIPFFEGVADEMAVPFRFPDPIAQANLLLFTSPSCRICEEVVRGVPGVARDDRIRVLVVSEGDVTANARLRASVGDRAVFTTDATRQKTLAVDSHPLAVVTDRDGTVIDKGMVNGPGDLQTLLERAERSMRAGTPATSGTSGDGR